MGAFSDMYNQVVTVNGVSKSFAMTGWRLGYIGAPIWLAKACTKIQGQFTSGTSGISQRAALAAISADPIVINDMKTAFLKRRDYILTELSKIKGIKINKPQGAFYVFPDVSSFFNKSYKDYTIKNSDDLTIYILESAKVALVTGNAFGSPNCVRISYASSIKSLQIAVRRIADSLNRLQ